jgi:hypothetical protein
MDAVGNAGLRVRFARANVTSASEEAEITVAMRVRPSFQRRSALGRRGPWELSLLWWVAASSPKAGEDPDSPRAFGGDDLWLG